MSRFHYQFFRGKPEDQRSRARARVRMVIGRFGNFFTRSPACGSKAKARLSAIGLVLGWYCPVPSWEEVSADYIRGYRGRGFSVPAFQALGFLGERFPGA